MGRRRLPGAATSCLFTTVDLLDQPTEDTTWCAGSGCPSRSNESSASKASPPSPYDPSQTSATRCLDDDPPTR
jgi:hypothetical protein